MSTSHFSRPQPHPPRQQRQEEDQERSQQPIRIVILLEERQPIGLELDFSAEVSVQLPALTRIYLVAIRTVCCPRNGELHSTAVLSVSCNDGQTREH